MSRTVVEEALRLMDAGIEFAIATVASARGSVPGKEGAKMIVQADGRQFGTVGGAGLEEKTKAFARKCIAEKKGGIFPFDLMYYKEGGLDSLCGGTVQIVVEYIPKLPHVLICGGGHVGLAVARALVPLEYGYSVLDDRAEFASRDRFPDARGLHVAKPEEFFGRQDLGPYTHLLILGYSHQIDTAILHEAVKRFPGYIGLICSATKKREMFHRLKARGVTDAELERVEAPLGVPIGAESPAEIAVSIAASVIRHRRKGFSSEEEHAEKAGQAGPS
jgi:xanthine dehydrogenase accessory factor